MSSNKARGFSLIELMIVITLMLIMTAITTVTLQTTLKASRVSQAYSTTLGALRRAHDSAMAERKIYIATFSSSAVPNNIVLTIGETGATVATLPLPQDIGFNVVTGVPTSATSPPTTPDAFGTAGYAIDFDQGVSTPSRTAVYFWPDGTARDANGNINTGVV